MERHDQEPSKIEREIKSLNKARHIRETWNGCRSNNAKEESANTDDCVYGG